MLLTPSGKRIDQPTHAGRIAQVVMWPVKEIYYKKL